MTNMESIELKCSKTGCSWNFHAESLTCGNGEGWCAEAELLHAELSTFHTKQLADATTAINAVLAMIPPDSEGRKLSFVHSRMGTILAWVAHDGVNPDGAIGPDNTNEEIADALGLKDVDIEDPEQSF